MGAGYDVDGNLGWQSCQTPGIDHVTPTIPPLQTKIIGKSLLFNTSLTSQASDTKKAPRTTTRGSPLLINALF